MKGLDQRRAPETSISSAIRAVEQQAEARRLRSNESATITRKKFFALLDRLSGPLFANIAKAASDGRRDFNPSSNSDFEKGGDDIFQLDGAIDPDLLNEWLYLHDLRHVFWADRNGLIRW